MKNNIIFLASANFPDNIFGRRQRQLLGTPVKQPLCSLRFNSHAADAQPKIRGKLICSQCQTLFAVKVVVGNHKPPHRRHHRRAGGISAYLHLIAEISDQFSAFRRHAQRIHLLPDNLRRAQSPEIRPGLITVADILCQLANLLSGFLRADILLSANEQHRNNHDNRRRARRNGNRPPALSEQVLQFMFYLVEFLFDVHA